VLAARWSLHLQGDRKVQLAADPCRRDDPAIVVRPLPAGDAKQMNEWAKKAREAEESMGPQDAWRAMLQDDELGSQVQLLLGLLARMPKRKLIGACVSARQNISRLEAMGPLLDPSAWQTGQRFDNARHYSDVLAKLIELRELLPEAPE
jgi:hypothetical protein